MAKTAKKTRRSNVTTAKRRSRPTPRPLSPRIQGGPPAHKQAAARVQKLTEMAERAARCWELAYAGCTQMQIAKQLGVSVFTVNQDLQRYMREQLPLRGSDRVDRMREQQYALLQRLKRESVARLGTKDHNEAVSSILAVAQREAKLYDLDIRRTAGEPEARVMALLQGITAMFMELVPDPELRAQWVRGIQRRVRPQLAKQIEGAVVLPPDQTSMDEEQEESA